jgi:hypothetical protein
VPVGGGRGKAYNPPPQIKTNQLKKRRKYTTNEKYSLKK